MLKQNVRFCETMAHRDMLVGLASKKLRTAQSLTSKAFGDFGPVGPMFVDQLGEEQRLVQSPSLSGLLALILMCAHFPRGNLPLNIHSFISGVQRHCPRIGRGAEPQRQIPDVKILTHPEGESAERKDKQLAN